MPPTDSILRNDAEDTHWADVYLSTLDNLRSVWPHAWPGLVVVLTSCVHRLWPEQAPSPSSTGGQMIQAALAMALHMEDIAAQSSYEPQYHHRLHTADALTASCLLIQALQAQGMAVDDDWSAALLLAVISHDVLHPGGANRFAQEFERRSVKEMQGIAQAFQIDKTWLQRVSELILRTDPTLVAGNHDKVKNTSFVMNLDWACVLLNEADILASATSRYGPELGQDLAQEWALKNHPLHSFVGSAEGRLQFLSGLRFSTPASEAFRMKESVAKQLTLQISSRSV
jgi:hypothetical protein